jgi:hypothetical protein
MNTGDRNTGNRNQGDYCTGDFNLSDHEAGCFCTEEHKIRIFDIESDMTYDQWKQSEACRLLNKIDFRPTAWIYSEDMSEQEKSNYPTHETTGGYLKICDTCKAYINWWDSLSDKKKEVIKNIPNFDAEKFERITGIKM